MRKTSRCDSTLTTTKKSGQITANTRSCPKASPKIEKPEQIPRELHKMHTSLPKTIEVAHTYLVANQLEWFGD